MTRGNTSNRTNRRLGRRLAAGEITQAEYQRRLAQSRNTLGLTSSGGNAYATMATATRRRGNKKKEPLVVYTSDWVDHFSGKTGAYASKTLDLLSSSRNTDLKGWNWEIVKVDLLFEAEPLVETVRGVVVAALIVGDNPDTSDEKKKYTTDTMKTLAGWKSTPYLSNGSHRMNLPFTKGVPRNNTSQQELRVVTAGKSSPIGPPNVSAMRMCVEVSYRRLSVQSIPQHSL